MKKLLLLVLMSGFFAGAVVAQDQKDVKDHQEWDKKVKTELKKELKKITPHNYTGLTPKF